MKNKKKYASVKSIRYRRILTNIFLVASLSVGIGIYRYIAVTNNHQITSQNSIAHVLATETNTVYATDTFQRANQTYWGTSSDGQAWGLSASNNSAFSIINNIGNVAPTTANRYFGILGKQVGDSSVLVIASITSTSNSNWGPILRYSDSNDWYKAYDDGNNLNIKKDVSGTETIIATTSYHINANTDYSIRFQINNNSLSAKIWGVYESEPSNWNLVVADNSLTGEGNAGIRISSSNSSFNVTYFQASQIINAPTPTSTIQRYTCNGNNGQCIPEAQGYYTSSNCNNQCWGSITITPTPTSVPVVNHYSCNGNNGLCQLDANGYYTSSNCNNACAFGVTPPSGITTTPFPTNPQQITPTNEPSLPMGITLYPSPTNIFSNTPIPTDTPINYSYIPTDTPFPSPGSNPIENALSFLQDLNPFKNSQQTPTPLPNNSVPNPSQKDNLLYQEAAYNPSNMEYNVAKMITSTAKTPITFFSFILYLNNVIKDFVSHLFQHGVK